MLMPKDLKRLLTLGALLLSAYVSLSGAVLAGEAFKCKGKNGETIFSDQPCKNAEIIQLHETQTYAPTPVSPPSNDPATKTKKPAKLSILVTSPANDSVIFDNEGNVSISVSVSPALPPGHKLLVTMNGSPLGPPSSQSSFSLQNVDRGEYSVSASVLDEKGKVLETSPASHFTLHRTSVQNKQGQVNPYKPNDPLSPAARKDAERFSVNR